MSFVWSTFDEALLREMHAEGKSDMDIAAKFLELGRPRTEKSISGRRARLRLKVKKRLVAKPSPRLGMRKDIHDLPPLNEPCTFNYRAMDAAYRAAVLAAHPLIKAGVL